MKSITVTELKELLKKSNINLLDVREVDEYAQSHIDQATLLPLSTFPKAIETLDKNDTYYLICRSGRRSVQAGIMMEDEGFEVINVKGGMLEFYE
ncbi:rhodanese-like domain-containing protein [Companilactobacillus sp. RD055328]|uniref:rhodanese-like domain-containing protein n=1 Tax=Companilactobacillus sp. RD055328 TaxID=2916634 RepID=UPI001FC7EDF0|nr:rhodanese-like domain-containing protein [Companilactobacillus sp. RD055328]GKQ42195.1 rhodanese-like domain-containing protein [Companilactobacillus sp. RD055328]